jgi:hypothetical protein
MTSFSKIRDRHLFLITKVATPSAISALPRDHSYLDDQAMGRDIPVGEFVESARQAFRILDRVTNGD